VKRLPQLRKRRRRKRQKRQQQLVKQQKVLAHQALMKFLRSLLN
jgi:hypothetical protein